MDRPSQFYTYAYSDADPNPNPDSNPNPDPNSDTDAHANADANSHADPIPPTDLGDASHGDQPDSEAKAVEFRTTGRPDGDGEGRGEHPGHADRVGHVRRRVDHVGYGLAARRQGC